MTVAEKVAEMSKGDPVVVVANYGGITDTLYLRITEVAGPRAQTYEVSGRGGFMASFRAAVEMARGEGWNL